MDHPLAHPLAHEVVDVDDSLERVVPEKERFVRAELPTRADVTQDISGVARLLASGSHRPAAALAAQLLQGKVASDRDRLLLVAFRCAALAASGSLGDAASEIDAVGDLNSLATEPPFLLRYVRAQLRAVSTPSALYELLEWCTRGVDGSPTEQERELWIARECWTLSAIAARHSQSQEYVLAIAAVERIVARRPRDPRVLSDIGRLYLLIGGLAEASVFFHEAELLVADGAKSPLAMENAALLKISRGEYSPAIELLNGAMVAGGAEFRGRTELANNVGACWAYVGNLTRAVNVFRESVCRDACGADDALVSNLSVLYDITSDTADMKKAELSEFLRKYHQMERDPTSVPRTPTTPSRRPL